MGLNELDHLRYSLSGEDWQKISNQEVLVGFPSGRRLWLEPAECDALSIVGATTSAINKGSMEAVNIEVLIIDEKALTNGNISIVESANIKSKCMVRDRRVLT